MGKGYIELDLEKIEEEHINLIVPNLVTFSKETASQYTESSLFQQMQGFSAHNIARLAQKVKLEVENVRDSILNISNYVNECEENYSNLDHFLSGDASAVTTSSSANSVIGSMNLDYNHLDFEIPNGKVKLDYDFRFSPIVREEKNSFPMISSNKRSVKDSDSNMEDIL